MDAIFYLLSSRQTFQIFDFIEDSDEYALIWGHNNIFIQFNPVNTPKKNAQTNDEKKNNPIYEWKKNHAE